MSWLGYTTVHFFAFIKYPMVPIGVLLRKRKSSIPTKSKEGENQNVVDIEQRIAALERELQSSTDSSSDIGDADILEELDDHGSVLKVLSPLCASEDMQIKPLPRNLLPAAHCAPRTNRSGKVYCIRFHQLPILSTILCFSSK